MPIRSLIFTLLYYVLTIIFCIAFIPCLLLPRRYFIKSLMIYFRLLPKFEKWILGLRYEIRGSEHLPKDGRFILGAKHQSTYETMKLHILLGDPTVILKRELLMVPIWGWLARKAEVIAIDRGNREQAFKMMTEGAKDAAEKGRPIVIFPQGTRVGVDTGTDKRPYKFGIARIAEATGLPIVPMALNSGYFWPRRGLFAKKGGTVIFEFLPAISPELSQQEMIAKLSAATEEKSKALLEEAQQNVE